MYIQLGMLKSIPHNQIEIKFSKPVIQYSNMMMMLMLLVLVVLANAFFKTK